MSLLDCVLALIALIGLMSVSCFATYGIGTLIYRSRGWQKRRRAREYAHHMKHCGTCRVWLEIIEENRAAQPDPARRQLTAEQRARVRAAAGNAK